MRPTHSIPETHGPLYLAIRAFVRKNLPALIRPWTLCKRLYWLVRYPTAKKRFEKIYQTNYWASGQSYSGEGSTLDATTKVREALAGFIAEHGIRSMLDIPCGDFHWMKHVALPERYTGADLVESLIARNRAAHASPERIFEVLDFRNDPLPQCDLVFSRDCLNHLSLGDIDAVIANLKKSGARFFGVTQFPAVPANANQETGFTYRELDFCKPPFAWPPPLAAYPEDKEGKMIAFWRVDDIP